MKTYIKILLLLSFLLPLPSYAGGIDTFITTKYNACGLDDVGVAYCWGKKTYDLHLAPNFYGYRKLSGYGDFICGIGDGGFIKCWGNSVDPGYLTPPPVFDVQEISLSSAIGCYLRGGEISCWGANSDARNNAPTGSDFISLGSSNEEFCAIKNTGVVECWGYDNGFGELTPPPFTDFLKVAGGYQYFCGLRSGGSITCWGNTANGRLSVPSGNYITFDSGYRSSCAIRTDNRIQCWGDDYYGQVSEAPTDPNYVAVGVSLYNACALNKDGFATCWGKDNDLIFEDVLDSVEFAYNVVPPGDDQYTDPGDDPIDVLPSSDPICTRQTFYEQSYTFDATQYIDFSQYTQTIGTTFPEDTEFYEGNTLKWVTSSNYIWGSADNSGRIEDALLANGTHINRTPGEWYGSSDHPYITITPDPDGDKITGIGIYNNYALQVEKECANFEMYIEYWYKQCPTCVATKKTTFDYLGVGNIHKYMNTDFWEMFWDGTLTNSILGNPLYNLDEKGIVFFTSDKLLESIKIKFVSDANAICIDAIRVYTQSSGGLSDDTNSPLYRYYSNIDDVSCTWEDAFTCSAGCEIRNFAGGFVGSIDRDFPLGPYYCYPKDQAFACLGGVKSAEDIETTENPLPESSVSGFDNLFDDWENCSPSVSNGFCIFALGSGIMNSISYVLSFQWAQDIMNGIDIEQFTRLIDFTVPQSPNMTFNIPVPYWDPEKGIIPQIVPVTLGDMSDHDVYSQYREEASTSAKLILAIFFASVYVASIILLFKLLFLVFTYWNSAYSSIIGRILGNDIVNSGGSNVLGFTANLAYYTFLIGQYISMLAIVVVLVPFLGDVKDIVLVFISYLLSLFNAYEYFYNIINILAISFITGLGLYLTKILLDRYGRLN